jgi:hypothetical protein
MEVKMVEYVNERLLTQMRVLRIHRLTRSMMNMCLAHSNWYS